MKFLSHLKSIKKPIFFLGLLFFLASCNNKDQQFCDCLEVAKKLDAVNQEILTGERTAENINEVKALKKTQTEMCQKYFQMAGEEMLQLKEACK